MTELLVGIDWSQARYDVCFLNPAGAILSEFQVTRTAAGYKQLKQKINQIGLSAQNCLVGIETAHDIMVDFLLTTQYQVYIVAPSIVSSARGRFGNSGAHTDKTDARLIADLLRTDRARFTPWRPDGALLQQIKVSLNHIDNLTRSIVQHTNRLRAALQRTYPQVLDVFSTLNTKICLRFLKLHPQASSFESVSSADFAKFCRENGCYRPLWIKNWYAGLRQTTVAADESVAQAYSAEITFTAQLLITLLAEKQRTIDTTHQLFLQHPDHEIFASLPGAGKLLQPKLLLMFGEDRDRFPTAASIRQLAGTCPVTKQSGKARRVVYRTACNHDYRNTIQQYAIVSLSKADWAAAYYKDARSRGHTKNSSFRRLANRWLGVIWKLWHTRQLYDSAYHLQQLHQHRKPN